MEQLSWWKTTCYSRDYTAALYCVLSFNTKFLDLIWTRWYIRNCFKKYAGQLWSISEGDDHMPASRL